MATIKKIMEIAGAEAGARAERLASGMDRGEMREFLNGILERLRDEDVLGVLEPISEFRGEHAGEVDPKEIPF